MGGILGGLVSGSNLTGRVILAVLIGSEKAGSDDENAEMARIAIGILALSLAVGFLVRLVSSHMLDFYSSYRRTGVTWGVVTFGVLVISAALHFMIKRSE